MNRTGIIAISSNKSYQRYSKSACFKPNDFANFLKTLPEKLPETKDYLILLNNSKVHNAVELEPTWASLKEKKFDKKFFPPHSPFLNPLEYVFDSVKKKLAGKELSSNLASEISNQLQSVVEDEGISYIQKAKHYYVDCSKLVSFRGTPLFPVAIE